MPLVAVNLGKAASEGRDQSDGLDALDIRKAANCVIRIRM